MANVMDYKCEERPPDLLKSIFEHQHKLAEKYIPIEKSNGLCLYDQLPADIDNAKAQARIKDMSWRCIEEVAEAMEAKLRGEEIHFKEELADALHFLIEKYLLCDFYPSGVNYYHRIFINNNQLKIPEYFSSLYSHFKDITTKPSNICTVCIESAIAEFIIACGLTCNCLKNKPWKQSQMLTDESYFRNKLSEEFKAFINLCWAAGFTAETLYDMYMRKNQVNQFRQKSNY